MSSLPKLLSKDLDLLLKSLTSHSLRKSSCVLKKEISTHFVQNGHNLNLSK